ncbi:GNAT family N-acetyltransferase [Croceicoccus marinus]|uniref:GNAT family N-acetyltransferase n=1 Tax=Croceicoccus marinus TaxID=450378 RepID=A0A7G6W192_9SPHN|nr:GNAT family N-acetyltransferase [Croceicoccus marinus]QNE07757.1 GNAT family N-acetyltransferase [Croceicoccus marinus]
MTEHRLDEFDCGKEPLDTWLRAHALDNEGKASRTYVVADFTMRVCAYYTLALGSVIRAEVPRKHRQNLPNPVPVMVLGRLAVDSRHGGRGLGPAMLREAMQRTLLVERQAGALALIVHAIDDDAVGFYAKYGFQVFPVGTRTMFLPVDTIRATVEADTSG